MVQSYIQTKRMQKVYTNGLVSSPDSSWAVTRLVETLNRWKTIKRACMVNIKTGSLLDIVVLGPNMYKQYFFCLSPTLPYNHARVAIVHTEAAAYCNHFEPRLASLTTSNFHRRHFFILK